MQLKMFFPKAEHNPPHFHVIYGEYGGLIDIETGVMIEGDLPARAYKLIKEWADKNKAELREMWDTQKLKKLPPLE
jgi:hypothetical protein